MAAQFTLRESITALSAFAACLVCAAPATLAQETPVTVYAQPDNVRTERVSYRDLDLVTRAGQRTLENRVSGAVRRVCLFDPDSAGLSDRGYFICAGEAWQDARPQIAQAIARAQDLALNGRSSIAAAAITISVR